MKLHSYSLYLLNIHAISEAQDLPLAVFKNIKAFRSQICFLHIGVSMGNLLCLQKYIGNVENIGKLNGTI